MIASIAVYGITYMISCIFIYLSERVRKTKQILGSKKLYNKLWIGLIILFPVLLATIRKNTGTDYISYFNNYDFYRNIDFVTYIKMFAVHSGNIVEPLYYLICRIVYLIIDNEIGLFCISSWLTLLFVLKSILKYQEKVSGLFGLFIYFMMYYQMSYNTVRQAIAYSFVLYAITFIPERNLKKFIFYILTATLFHRSAIICIILYLIVIIIDKKIEYLYYVGLLILPIAFKTIIELVLRLEFFKSYALIYTLDYSQLYIGSLLICLPVVLPIIAFNKQIKGDSRVLYYIYLLVIPFSFFSNYFLYAFRMGTYFSYLEIILIPLFIRTWQNRWIRNLFYMYFSGWYVTYYFYYYIITNFNETYPYMTIFN